MKIEDNDWINEIYLKVTIQDLEEENKNLKEKVETLELRLDNKEKLNEEYRKEIDKLREKYGDLDY